MCISKHNLAPISRNIFGHNATSQSAGSTFLVGIKPVSRSVEMSRPLLCEVLKDCTSLSGLEQLQKLLSQQFVVGDTTQVPFLQEGLRMHMPVVGAINIA